MRKHSFPSSFLYRLFRWRLFFLINLLVLIVLVVTFTKEFARTYTVQQEIRRLQVQAEALRSKNLEIQSLAKTIQSEGFLEREARLKLGLRKPGEHVLILEPDHAPSASEPSLSATAPSAPLSSTPGSATSVANPRKWWYYFFDKNMFDALVPYGTPS